MNPDESKIANSKIKSAIGTKKIGKHDISINTIENGIDFECYNETEAEKWVEVINNVVNLK